MSDDLQNLLPEELRKLKAELLKEIQEKKIDIEDGDYPVFKLRMKRDGIAHLSEEWVAGFKKAEESAYKEIDRCRGKIKQIDDKLLEKKEEKVLEKVQANEEESAKSKWLNFQNAFEVYSKTNMCFLNGPRPVYFHKLVTVDKDRKTGDELIKTSLETKQVPQIGINYPKLESKTAQRYFRMLVSGEEITLQNPETGEYETFRTESHEYVKMVNTRHINDPATYNIVDLSNIVKPQEVESVECPLVLQALIIALSGSKLILNEEGILKPTKPKTIDWLERWVYGITSADPGNNFLPMPIWWGEGKVGKNALCDFVVPGLLGRTQCFSGTWSTFESNFNGFKLGKLFVFIDEIPERDEWSNIKNKTGSCKEFIKEKYGMEYEIDNTICYAMGSNHKHYPLPIEDGHQMMRVSPIDVNSGLKFAEATYLLLNHQTPNFVEDALINMGIDLSKYTTIFAKGDRYLRETNGVWCGSDTLQQFANYLHKKHKPKGNFSLEPLREEDWDKLIKSRPSPVKETTDYILARDPDKISEKEIVEIYRVIAKKQGSERFLKSDRNLINEVATNLFDKGYVETERKRVKIHTSGGIKMEYNVRLFHKPNTDTRDYHVDIESYVRTVGYAGNRELVYLTPEEEE